MIDHDGESRNRLEQERSGTASDRYAAAGARSATAAAYRFIRESPTVATWGSLAARALHLIVLLPLLLRYLSAAEVALWYVFITVTSIQLILTMPISMTFARFVAFAAGGATPAEIHDLREAPALRDRPPSPETLAMIWGTMRRFYRRMVVAPLVLLGGAGSLAIQRPLSLVEDPGGAWFAWGAVVLVMSISLWGEQYSALLHGLERIGTVKRWETLTGAGSIGTAATVLLLGGGFVHVVVATQLWNALSVIINRQLSRAHTRALPMISMRDSGDTAVMRSIRGAAWRTSLGAFLATGTLQLANLTYAQTATAAALANYLVAFNLIANLRPVAHAPFTVRLPALSRLRAAGDVAAQRRMAAGAMAAVYWLFASLFLLIVAIAPFLLSRIGRETEMVRIDVWLLLGLAFFLESFGSMHLQVYTTTNHVVWPLVHGITGGIFVAAVLVLLPFAGVNAIPLGLIVAYAGFFTWYTARLSYRVLATSFWKLERIVFLPPLLLFLLCLTSVWMTAR